MQQQGMTLVELLVVMAVATVIGIFVLNLFITSNRTFMDQSRILDVQRDGRLVMEYMARTLREAGLNPHGASIATGVQEATANKIRIGRDSDLQGDLDSDTYEIVTFAYDGAQQLLRRGFGPAGSERWQVMADNVTTFSLNYQDAAGGDILPPPGTDPDSLDAIHSVEMTITFTDDKLIGGDFTRNYSTRLTLRND